MPVTCASAGHMQLIFLPKIFFANRWLFQSRLMRDSRHSQQLYIFFTSFIISLPVSVSGVVLLVAI